MYVWYWSMACGRALKACSAETIRYDTNARAGHNLVLPLTAVDWIDDDDRGVLRAPLIAPAVRRQHIRHGHAAPTHIRQQHLQEEVVSEVNDIT